MPHIEFKQTVQKLSIYKTFVSVILDFRFLHIVFVGICRAPCDDT